VYLFRFSGLNLLLSCRQSSLSQYRSSRSRRKKKKKNPKKQKQKKNRNFFATAVKMPVPPQMYFVWALRLLGGASAIGNMVLGVFGIDKGAEIHGQNCETCEDRGLQIIMQSLFLIVLGLFQLFGEIRHQDLLRYFLFLRFPLGRGLFNIFIGIGTITSGHEWDSAVILGSITIAIGVLFLILVIPGFPPATTYQWNPYSRQPSAGTAGAPVQSAGKGKGKAKPQQTRAEKV
jgi:hypothetical protein